VRARAETLPQGDEKVQMVTAMFDAIAPRYDLVNRVMTFGLDVLWRRRTVTALGLPPGAAVIDLACGTGDLCTALRRQGLRACGVDLSAGMLAAARCNDPLVRADVVRLPFPDAAFDGATCGFALRNVADLEAFLSEVARVVRPGGRIGLLEVSEPSGPLLRWGHRVWFGRAVPLIGGLLSDPAAYRYLPRSVAYLPPPDQLLASIAAAGFVNGCRMPLSGGIAQLFVGGRA